MFKPNEIKIEGGHNPNQFWTTTKYDEYIKVLDTMEIDQCFSVEITEANRKHITRIVMAAHRKLKDKHFGLRTDSKANVLRCFRLKERRIHIKKKK